MKLPFVRTVNAHGLVTIPAKMRHELGWKPGTKLVITVAGNHFVLQSVKDWKKEQRRAKPAKTKTEEEEAVARILPLYRGSKGVSPAPLVSTTKQAAGNGGLRCLRSCGL